MTVVPLLLDRTQGGLQPLINTQVILTLFCARIAYTRLLVRTFSRRTTKDTEKRLFLLNSLQEHGRQPFRTIPAKVCKTHAGRAPAIAIGESGIEMLMP